MALLIALVSVATTVPAVTARAAEIDLVFPHDPHVTEFTSSFGAARAGHSHRGNDLMAPKMSPVFAVAPGTVIYIRDRGTAGRYVTIDHGGGWETWYMHLNDDTPGTDDGAAPIELGVVVEVGQEVVAGQLIGWVGDSGNAEGSSPHTHFELHRNGSAINPYPYLVEAYERALASPRNLTGYQHTPY